MSRKKPAAIPCLTYSVPEGGRIGLGLGPKASYRAAADGYLPIIRIGRRVRVSVRALEEMIERGTIPVMVERGTIPVLPGKRGAKKDDSS